MEVDARLKDDAAGKAAAAVEQQIVELCRERRRLEPALPARALEDLVRRIWRALVDV